MAANIKDEEERNRRIIMVGEFIIEHPSMSTRKIADYFSKNYFRISNATVHDYLERYKKMIVENREQIEKIMNDNKAKSIADNDVVERVKLVTKKYLEENKTIEQISMELGINFWTIYRDLNVRLPLLNQELSKLVEEKMNNSKIENLKNQKK